MSVPPCTPNTGSLGAARRIRAALAPRLFLPALVLGALVLLQGCGQSPPSGASQTPRASTQAAAAPESREIAFQNDAQAAMAQARAQHRLVMVDLYTDWCVWCKKLDTDVYTSPAVVKEVARGFVPLKLNPEKQKEGADLAVKHSVQGYPSILFLDGSGKLVGRLDGFVPAEQFVKVLKDATKAYLAASHGA